jgi:hypothetical protein
MRWTPKTFEQPIDRAACRAKVILHETKSLLLR